MTKQIEAYLTALRDKLVKNDPAIVQDALADAEEHLRTALEEAKVEQPEAEEKALVTEIIEQYGSTDEIAHAYQTVEDFTPTRLVQRSRSDENVLSRFFGVYGDPKAWAALLYMLISLVTGTVYFTWAVTGFSLSVSFALFIFGLPVAAFFLYSVRGFALIEGRIVEALLGERMPRRAVFAPQGEDWKGKLKHLFTDKHTWLMILYMLLMLPLGVAYFTTFVTILAVSLSFIIAPIANIFYDFPIMINDNIVHYLTPEYGVLMFFVGIVALTASMHLAKGLGFLQAKIAKFILVAR